MTAINGICLGFTIVVLLSSGQGKYRSGYVEPQVGRKPLWGEVCSCRTFLQNDEVSVGFEWFWRMRC